MSSFVNGTQYFANGDTSNYDHYSMYSQRVQKMHHVWAESGAFSRAHYKLIQIKFSNFVGLYFSHFTITFRNQTLQFY
jgi:hypothetical protein